MTNDLVLFESPLDQPIPVLILSGKPKEHAKVRLLLEPVEWLFYGASTFAEARIILQEHVIAVVITETALIDGRWTTLFVCTASNPNPPYIIPLADLEDHEFWAEAFNEGAFDVVYRPIVKTPIVRAITVAFQRWKRAAEREEAKGATPITLVWPVRKSRASRSRWFSTKVLAAGQN